MQERHITFPFLRLKSAGPPILMEDQLFPFGRKVRAIGARFEYYQLAQNAYVCTALQIVCPLTTSLSKLGVLCLLNRIFRQSGRWYRIAIHTTFCLVLAITFAQVLIPFINCRLFSKNWRPEEPGICAIAGLSLWRYLDIPNVSTTLFTVAIPLPALVKLHVTQGTKLGLVVVFGVCVLGVGAAIMRVRSFLEVVDFNDITYQNVKPLCWTIVESGIYVVAGVLPTFKPLLRKIFKDTALGTLLSRSSQGSTNSERKWFCRGQNKGSPRDALSGAEKQHSLSELTVETAVSVETDSPRRDTSRTRDAEARQLHW
jgi:hypothetical protein